MTHPLTDDLADDIASTELECPFGIGEIVFTYNDMRAAADWQLEQVLEWLKATKSTVNLCPSILAAQLELAMRPQEDNL